MLIRTALPADNPMKRTLDGAAQVAAVPSGIELLRLCDLGGAIQRRLSPIH